MPDDRVPGDAGKHTELYACPICGRLAWSAKTPRCPFDGVSMERTDKKPYEDRITEIEQARKKGKE